MTDIDAHHPEKGCISLKNTPKISQRFLAIQTLLHKEGKTYSGSAEDGYLDSTQASNRVSKMLGLLKPSGYIKHCEYATVFENANWGHDDISRMIELFMKVCLEEKLDFYFS